MITKRYVRLTEAKEKLIGLLNDAKERGNQAGAEIERIENELFTLSSLLEEEERRMSPISPKRQITSGDFVFFI